MKGHYEIRADGQRADVPPCRTCRHKNKMTVEAPCYNCISQMQGRILFTTSRRGRKTPDGH